LELDWEVKEFPIERKKQKVDKVTADFNNLPMTLYEVTKTAKPLSS
jgi:hypothetical protein